MRRPGIERSSKVRASGAAPRFWTPRVAFRQTSVPT